MWDRRFSCSLSAGLSTVVIRTDRTFPASVHQTLSIISSCPCPRLDVDSQPFNHIQDIEIITNYHVYF